MKKEVVYRKIPVTERLPKEEGYYLGFAGEMNEDAFWFSTVGSNANKFSQGRFRNLHITHWLEEVQLPSEDDARKDFDKIPASLDVDFIDWFSGYKYLLDKILK